MLTERFLSKKQAERKVGIGSSTHTHTQREKEKRGWEGEENIHHNHLPKMPKSRQTRSFERETQREIVKGRLYTLMKADGDGHLGSRGVRGRNIIQ